MIGTNIVGIVKKDTFSYPDKEELFRPGERYPEYIFEEYSTLRNEIYDAVRESIKIMGLDRGRIGEKEWNPFGDFIMTGNTGRMRTEVSDCATSRLCWNHFMMDRRVCL